MALAHLITQVRKELKDLGKEARMTFPKEVSHLWLFESHNNSKRSQWLQSTLSELEEKTKGMLKLIEGDGDTFAQRAEMYYKKRPELVIMIEDFYRSYRSLAERYELLKLESGNSFSNRGYFPKEWSFIDKSSSSSSVICDSESEVDDPSEEDQVESKLREVPRNKNGNDLVNLKRAGVGENFQVGMKRERPNLSTYSIDSELSEVSYLGPEEAKVENKLGKFLQKKSDICVVKQMIEKVERTEVEARAVAVNKCFEHPEFMHGKPKEGQDKDNLAEFPRKGDSNLSNSNILIEESERIQGAIKKMAEVSPESSFKDLKVLHREREETQGDNNEVELIMSEVERLQGENTSFKAELERKDEEKREVIRHLSLSIDILKGENDSMKKFIRDSKNRTSLFEFRKLKGVLSKSIWKPVENSNYTGSPLRTARVHEEKKNIDGEYYNFFY